jgi:hypothetical protein
MKFSKEAAKILYTPSHACGKTKPRYDLRPRSKFAAGFYRQTRPFGQIGDKVNKVGSQTALYDAIGNSPMKNCETRLADESSF